MTFSDFLATYNGKGVDYDHFYGNQCMDLYRLYVEKVLNLPQSPPVRGAAWIRSTYDQSKYDWFANTPLAVPKPGDILIWDTRAGGGFGHVAIYISGNVLSFTSFDLNWPSQGYYDKYGNFIGTGVAHYQGHNYFGGLVGWIRPKVAPTPPTPPQNPNDILVNKITKVLQEPIDGNSKIAKIREILK